MLVYRDGFDQRHAADTVGLSVRALAYKLSAAALDSPDLL
jgi:hypothetical protein